MPETGLLLWLVITLAPGPETQFLGTPSRTALPTCRTLSSDTGRLKCEFCRL